MILLHGGLSLEMIYGILGGFVCSIVVFVFLIRRGLKSHFYTERAATLSGGQRLIIYLLYILMAAFVSYLALIFFGLLAAWIASLFTK